METGSIPRPQQAANVQAAPRIEAPAVVSGVKTELRPSATVQQAGEGESLRFEVRPNLDKQVAIEQAFGAIEREIVVDPATRALIYRSVDSETGEVVSQLPEESILKLRAFVRGLNGAAREPIDHEVETRA